MTIYDNENIYQLFFNELANYEDMEVLFRRFENNLNTVLIEKLDGPYSRIWKILINENEYKLVIDESYGSYLIAEKEISKVGLKKLLPLIEKFIC